MIEREKRGWEVADQLKNKKWEEIENVVKVDDLNNLITLSDEKWYLSSRLSCFIMIRPWPIFLLSPFWWINIKSIYHWKIFRGATYHILRSIIKFYHFKIYEHNSIISASPFARGEALFKGRFLDTQGYFLKSAYLAFLWFFPGGWSRREKIVQHFIVWKVRSHVVVLTNFSAFLVQ